MIKLRENKLFIIEEDGYVITYSKEDEKSYRECLEEYGNRNELVIKTEENLVKKLGCIIIKNINDKSLMMHMPEKLSDDQIYQLDLFSSMSLDKVKVISGHKYKEIPEQFLLTGDVSEQFSNEIIQSYFETNQQKEKKNIN